MNKLPTKQIYLLFIIIVGIIALSVYSTYALFTFESETSNVVTIHTPTNLQISENIYEYQQITVEPNKITTTDIDIHNTQEYELCYSIWYKILGDIEKAIFESDLGYTPNNDGETIRIVIPELTEERRKELAKQVKAIAEEAKVSVRNIRHDGLEDVKKAELPEDEEKGMEKDIQDLVNEYNKKIEAKLKEKEQELLTV